MPWVFAPLGLGLGTLLHARGVRPHIVVGHDYRSYSMDVKNALITGLLRRWLHGL